MSESKLDLSRLALDRSPTAANGKKPRRRRWLSRYVLPSAVLLGFIALLCASAGRQLIPQQSVTVVPVIVKRGEVQQAGATLFQAAGWIEPRPTAIRVAALSPGVIEDLLVVEGQQVSRNEPIARLISADAELAVDRAKATLAIREGELQRVEAEREAAIIRLRQPVHLRVLVADANSVLAKAITELEKLPFLIEAAEASVAFTRGSMKGKQSAGSAIAGVIIEKAIKDHTVAVAELEELRKRQPNLKREVDALDAKKKVLQQQLRLLIEENRQLREANAKVISFTAIRDEAKLGLQQANLNLERNVVRAPINGRILRLVASPGSRVMGLEQNAGQNSSTVVEMYDPARLQVRADVRLEDVPLITPDAPVEIETASSGSMIRGRVLQSTSSANIQKNTLEVKVELLEPPANVRPEMLVTATFLAPQLAKADSEPTETERILVPDQLVKTGEGGAYLWIVDANNLAERKMITIGEATPDGLVEVLNGLNGTDKVISSGLESLSSGDAVNISGEDQTIGRGR